MEYNEIKEKILDYLYQNPGVKAYQIATALGIDRKIINKILYSDLKDLCRINSEYRWFLNNTNNKVKLKCNTPDSQEQSQTILSRLCRYYLECIEHDIDLDVKAFADSNSNDFAYCCIDALPLDNDISPLNTENTDKLILKIRKDRNRLKAYLGYPVNLIKIKSRKSSWEGFILKPIFLIPLDIIDGKFQIADSMPIINISAVKEYFNDKYNLMSELLELEKELGLGTEDIPDIDEITSRLHQIRPEWNWKENIDPYTLSNTQLYGQSIIDSEDKREIGIYNKAVIILSDVSKYTQGLTQELKDLSNLKYGEYKDTALGKWLSEESRGAGSNDGKDSSLLEVLPLNSEQRQAVRHSLTNDITIVTGPPGTGKSQVITNIIINAIWNRKKVLFASKNNKAVDVVELRVNSLTDYISLVRLGTGSSSSKSMLAKYLLGILDNVGTNYDKENFEILNKQYLDLDKRYNKISQYEELLITTRNQTDLLEKNIEIFRAKLSNSVFDNLKNINTDKLKSDIDDLNKLLVSATKEEQNILNRIIWSYIYKKRFECLRQYLDLTISPYIKLLEPNIEYTTSDLNIINLTNQFITILEESLSLASKIQAYIESLKKLQGLKQPDEIAKEKNKISKQITNISKELWSYWLKIRTANMSASDRRKLTKYKTFLKILKDKSDLDQQERKIYNKLSNDISHFISGMAVTSLSVKGKIPLESNFFDIVIFDEASQCDIASALPLLYRAKQSVIIGDPLQLTHISNLSESRDKELMKKFNIFENMMDWMYSKNSLYELASGLVDSSDIITLKDHHRSHKNIIEFSNKYFYRNTLRIATNYNNLKLLEGDSNGLRWVNIVGEVLRPTAGSVYNKIEAENVLYQLRDLVNKQYSGSIGVVTPFRAQANYIRELVNRDTDLYSKLLNNDFLVDTVHKFQGDERHIMIFSPVVSNNMQKKTLEFMEREGNLFNVAITRAKSLLLVVGDLQASMACGVSYMEKFAKYCVQLETEKETMHKTVNDFIPTPDYPIVARPELVSEWEHILYKELFKNNIKVIPQYNLEKYVLDFALFHGNKMLNIEVDGEAYHRNWNGELCRRDIMRNERLFELGWDVMRFWVYEIRDDMDNCIKRIKNWINKSSEIPRP